MSAPTIIIACATSELQDCSPSLMPFHIDYSGPAEVSAFMRVEEFNNSNTTVASRDIEMKDTEEFKTEKKSEEPNEEKKDKDTNKPIVPSSSTDSVMTESTLVAEFQSSGSKHLNPPPLEDADRRFVSTFRGRTIHGLTIDLPPGFSGLVLRAEGAANSYTRSEDIKPTEESKASKAEGKGKARATVSEPKPKPRGRLTRSAISKQPIVVEDKEEVTATLEPNTLNESEVDTGEGLPDSKPTRTFIPQSQFSSFTLWHADRPVDKGNDEYARTLAEWFAISKEIHRTDL